MVLVLFLITLFASGAVAVVYRLTEAPIAAARAAKDAAAISLVLPAFDNDILTTGKKIAIDGDTTVMYTATQDGTPVGYAVQTFTKKGYSGLITLMVGFRPDGTIHGIEVLQHAETPGLGSNMTEPGNVLAVSFEGKSPTDLKMSVRKEGGDIDALTASTITSKAYIDAVDRAWRVFSDDVKGVQVEATSGATANAAQVDNAADTASGATAAATSAETTEKQTPASHE